MSGKILTREELRTLMEPIACVNGSSLHYCRITEHDAALRELLEEALEALECGTEGDIDCVDKYGLRKRMRAALGAKADEVLG